jgi:hypothetical protein
VSIAQRMETGWVRPEWVQTFDFSRSTIPLSQSITLHAVEDGAPPSGEFTGVEIRIADGWNYYFEYRRTEAGQVGDQLLGLPACGSLGGARAVVFQCYADSSEHTQFYTVTVLSPGQKVSRTITLKEKYVP